MALSRKGERGRGKNPTTAVDNLLTARSAEAAGYRRNYAKTEIARERERERGERERNCGAKIVNTLLSLQQQQLLLSRLLLLLLQLLLVLPFN